MKFCLDVLDNLFIIAPMKVCILVIDDEKDLLELLRMTLEGAGYEVETAASGAEAVARIRRHPPDLILLDVMLEDVSGIKLTGRLKNAPETANIPILMLTAKDSETDMVVGLSVGADDYMTKPFSNAVLLARIEALLRRASLGQDDFSNVLSVGGVRLNTARRQAYVDDRLIDLTPSEFEILLALMEAGGDVCSRGELHQRLEAVGHAQNERIIDVHVACLRKKIGKSRNLIKTVHGRGYRVRI